MENVPIAPSDGEKAKVLVPIKFELQSKDSTDILVPPKQKTPLTPFRSDDISDRSYWIGAEN